MAKPKSSFYQSQNDEQLIEHFNLSKWGKGTFITNTHGNTRCIIGYMHENQRYDLPYYAPSVASHDSDGPSSGRFVELRHGALFKTSLPLNFENYSVRSDIFLSLPTGSDSSYGVLTYETRSLELALTEQLFGGTQEQIDAIAIPFSKIIGRGFNHAIRLPRVTFSKTRDNPCDISEHLIPSNFPYLAFDQSQYAWSHVSLYSFFRMLAFLCPIESPVRQALEGEVDNQILQQVINAGSEEIFNPMLFSRY